VWWPWPAAHHHILGFLILGLHLCPGTWLTRVRRLVSIYTSTSFYFMWDYVPSIIATFGLKANTLSVKAFWRPATVLTQLEQLQGTVLLCFHGHHTGLRCEVIR
jgi:hypothetical protein